VININFEDSIPLLQEADILLFRAKDSIFSLSYWVAKYGFGKYSHVSMVNFNEGVPYCIEFREFIGSRNHPLVEELNNGYVIDVFRISRSISHSEFDKTTGAIGQTIKEFTPEVAKRIIDTAKEHVDRKESYSWSLIWKISGIFIPLYRLFVNRNPIIEEESEHFVCSTFVAYSYRKHFIDLVPGISDVYTQPSDISRSAYLNYLFTIQAGKK
jgi:hypothetical protein